MTDVAAALLSLFFFSCFCCSALRMLRCCHMQLLFCCSAARVLLLRCSAAAVLQTWPHIYRGALESKQGGRSCLTSSLLISASLSPLPPCTSQYEPEIFPALTYRMKVPKIVLKIFASGKVTLTGGSVWGGAERVWG